MLACGHLSCNKDGGQKSPTHLGQLKGKAPQEPFDIADRKSRQELEMESEGQDSSDCGSWRLVFGGGMV
jgi:hypothetical protein